MLVNCHLCEKGAVGVEVDDCAGGCFKHRGSQFCGGW